MNKILISACLLGEKVCYDGRDNLQTHPRLQEWIKAGRVIAICPEVAGGLSTPRPAARIESGYEGIDVINNKTRIITDTQEDITRPYLAGAKKALALAKQHHIKVAILKARSPSCGSKQIYEGDDIKIRYGSHCCIIMAFKCLMKLRLTRR